MNTAEILKKCRALPGVTVKTEKDYADLLLSDGGGNGKMRFIPMFPGITLAQITVNAPSWPAPEPDLCTPDAKGPLVINYCTRGRCELVLNDNKSVFLTSGQISLTEKFAQNKYIYPGRCYEGIEIFIDPESASEGVPMLLDGFGLDITGLGKRYCPDGETFISGMSLPEDVTAGLCRRFEDGGEMTYIRMKTGVIGLIALLLYGRPESEAEKIVYYTRSQVEIAKKIESIIAEDLTRRHTVREFAELFSVSESSIKNYFHGVFGQSISQYMTHKKMVHAAGLLSDTRLSVVEVAGRVGYESQSKFASAFRREFGATPLEYRRSRNITKCEE